MAHFPLPMRCFVHVRRTPIALAAFVLLTACSYGGTPPAEPPSPPPAAESGDSPIGAIASVTIENFAFAPASLRIAKGTTVIWTNNDAAPHAIGTNGTFTESPTLGQGQSYAITFPEAGTFSYYCTIHPSMKGSIEVTE